MSLGLAIFLLCWGLAIGILLHKFVIGPPIILRKKERMYSRTELKAATLRAMRVGATKIANERVETVEEIHTEWFENQFPID